jgi:hypothetical protein
VPSKIEKFSLHATKKLSNEGFFCLLPKANGLFRKTNRRFRKVGGSWVLNWLWYSHCQSLRLVGEITPTRQQGVKKHLPIK